MAILLTALAAILLLVFLIALLAFVIKITSALESIGTSGKSSLAMITWGVRAIEVETSHIPTQVTQLNGALSQVAAGLQTIDGGLVAIAETAGKQERYR